MSSTAPRFTHTRANDGAPLTATDSATGLQWAVKALPRAKQSQQIAACAALDLDGHTDWRLPTRAELLTLVDLTKYDPCIDTDAFPEFPASWFWTSDECAWSSASAWLVGFYDGHVYYLPRGLDGFALAVRRAGQ
ncbi:MAG: DUF1566 domain-containing protein [Pseudoxanthomonas sp.]